MVFGQKLISLNKDIIIPLKAQLAVDIERHYRSIKYLWYEAKENFLFIIEYHMPIEILTNVVNSGHCVTKRLLSVLLTVVINLKLLPLQRHKSTNNKVIQRCGKKGPRCVNVHTCPLRCMSEF